MRIESALLCDSATVREGLIHVLGGGITHIGRDAYPAPLALTVALVIEVEDSDVGRSQKFTISIESAAGEQVATIEGGWDSGSVIIDPSASAYLPVTLKLDQVAIPAPGNYIIRFDLDGADSRVVKLKAADSSESFGSAQYGVEPE